MHALGRVFARVNTRSATTVLQRTFSTHGSILLKATKAPEKTLEEIGIDKIKERVANTDYGKIGRSNLRVEDELYDETGKCCLYLTICVVSLPSSSS